MIDTKKTMNISMLLALSIILSIVESIIPIFNGSIPGLKVGLANIIVLYSLYKFNFKDAFLISILRVILVSILRTGLFSINFFFSISGAILSIIMMYLFKKTKLSIIGVSIIGSISHSIGQVIIAIIFLNNISYIYYLPILIIFSIVTGIIIGYLSDSILKRTKDLI